MKKKYFFLLLLLSFLKPIYSQVELSVYSEVSIVTAGPGTELYSAFGHSAVRIKDPVLNLDIIYNYGVFDFNAPNFYSNFAKGNLIYTLARYDFKYFLRTYNNEKRWVKQQVLNLTRDERQAYFLFLEDNAKPSNANYSYDPYFNNCATILRDITKSILKNKVAFNDNHLVKDQTLRSLMDKELYWNTWGSFGINLIAGTILDKKATTSEYMYLPDYVYDAFKHGTIYIKNQPENLVKREDVLLNFKENKQKSGLFNPFIIFSILAILGIFITSKDFKNNKRTKVLDFILFFITGVIGCVIAFLWFFSSHSTAPNNFNFLWAFAPNLIVSFILLKNHQHKWLQKYLQLLILFLIVIPILWLARVQGFPIAVIPLLILLLVRYLYLLKNVIVRDNIIS
ncbi:DUF4105 domain-containing protein [Polaribacter pectinis]|uniref:DUF4105 domain-containing protein n=1 Tax=Polaribacter pectinis TaxID=2738844 RepID=A0A7G9LCC9_9FLAO|nr:DUF4105 domain-containing protein [Polaribacter pectinis]QNM86278.1 DUF4105 domain-containing protein [Polaribacter pectinis]